jgi:hypothetical protein
MVLASGTNSSAIYIGWGIAFIIWVLCLAWTISIARKKGRSAFGWGVLAFFFSWIALLVILLMPSRRTA